MKKTPKITVIYGGVGPEREVSLVSGRAVIEGLKERWDVVEIELQDAALPEGLDPEETVVFIALHGTFGEDGQIQRLLEDAGVIYVGSDSRSSYVCMQKSFSKALAAARGVPILPEILFENSLYSPQAQEVISKLGEDIVLKPMNGGSSAFNVLCSGVTQLQVAMKGTQRGLWMMEPRIRGRELTVGILDAQALSVVEIRPKGEFYDYKHKYTKGATEYLCPAPLPRELSEAVMRAAENAYSACGCRDFARADFLFDEARGQFFFLEINTLPGLTALSLLPMSAKARGYDFKSLLDAMLSPAIERFHKKSLRRPGTGSLT